MSSEARKAAPVLPQYEQPFLAAFIKATVETIAVQCGIKVTAGAPIAKAKFEEEGADVVVVGGILGFQGGIAGKTVDCTVAFCFSDSVCLELLNGMVHKKLEMKAEQLMGAASELVRIIGFQAKKLLKERGYEVEALFPRIVVDGKRVVVWTDKWDPLESTCRHASLSIL